MVALVLLLVACAPVVHPDDILPQRGPHQVALAQGVKQGAIILQQVPLFARIVQLERLARTTK